MELVSVELETNEFEVVKKALSVKTAAIEKTLEYLSLMRQSELTPSERLIVEMIDGYLRE